MIYFVLLFVVIAVYNFFNKSGFKNFSNFFEEGGAKRPKNFETSLLALSSFVIKADGVINKVELNYVRDHYVKTYGKENANASFRDFKIIMKQGVSARKLCAGIADFMPYPARVKLIVFLFGVAKSDGFVTQSEELEIRTIASYMLIRQGDYMRIQARYFEYQKTNNESSYSSTYSHKSVYEYDVLGVRENASIDEVKKAYRTLVKKYHPDRIQNGSKEAINVAKDKFQKIQSAYEKIKSERGF